MMPMLLCPSRTDAAKVLAPTVHTQVRAIRKNLNAEARPQIAQALSIFIKQTATQISMFIWLHVNCTKASAVQLSLLAIYINLLHNYSQIHKSFLMYAISFPAVTQQNDRTAHKLHRRN